jgi:hypothetical protein
MDGRRLASVNEQSFMTVNMYLNTVPLVHKGATRALSEPQPGLPFSGEVLGKVQPVLGMAAVFRDGLWHDGEELVEGEKVRILNFSPSVFLYSRYFFFIPKFLETSGLAAA